MSQCVIMNMGQKANNKSENFKLSVGKNKQNHGVSYDSIVFKDLAKGQPASHFYFDSDRGILYLVQSKYKETWATKATKFIQAGFGKVGIVNNQKNLSSSCLKSLLRSIVLKKGQMFENISFLISSVFGFLSRIKAMSQSEHLLPMIMDISSLLLQTMSPTYSNWTPSYLLGHLLRFYSIYVRGKALVQGQSGEALTLAAISTLLPPPLIEILKRMNLFTSKKLLDSPSSIYDCLVGLIDFFLWCISKIPGVPSCVHNFLSILSGFSGRSALLKTMCDHLTSFEKSRSVMLKEEWRVQVRKTVDSIKSSESLQQYFKSSVPMMAKWKDYQRLYRSLESYEKCSRKEPVAIIFEGPPGVRKSFMMSNLTELMGKSIYTHVVKSTTDGKDFYDTYNNEEVFVMDDVGQQGISQWRTIINMVSTIKLPLECAAADLKDTKFFNSDFILCTTNNFYNMTSLSKNDCISDLTALWRRCHVFNFNSVSLVDGKPQGVVQYMRYCPVSKAIVNTFPFESSLPVFMEISNKNKTLAWMNCIVKKLKEYYDDNYRDNQLTSSDRDIISGYEEELEDYSTPSGQSDISFRTSWLPLIIKYLKFIVWEGLTLLVATYCIDHLDSHWSISILVLVLSVFFVSLALNFFSDELLNFLGQDTSIDSESNPDRDLVDHWKRITGQSVQNAGTMADAVSSRMVVLEVIDNTSEKMTASLSQGLISGRFVISTQHSFQGHQSGILNAYKNWDNYAAHNILLNNVPYRVVFEDYNADLVIAELPTYMLSPFKSCKDYFKPDSTVSISKHPILVTPAGSYRATRNLSLENKNLTYRTYRVHNLEPGEFLEYENFSAPGLSGSLVVDPIAGIVGMHVAGDSTSGNAVVFTKKLIAKIRSILSDEKLIVDVNLIPTQCENFSGGRYETNLYQNIPSKSSIVPSPLHGVFPTTKEPANLSAFGPKTVEVMASKSFLPIPAIPQKEIDYAKSCLDSMIPTFVDITDEEVIGGNEILAPLNKKSVNGFGLEKEKEVYIDFENKCFFPETIEMMSELEAKVKDKSFTVEDVLYYETLKDELRVQEKINKPRSFRVCRLPLILWQKRIFGDLFQQILRDSDFNLISLGTNPYADFDKYYREMTRMHILFDLDIGTFDGKQAAQVQDAVAEVVLKKYKGQHPEMANFLLEVIVRSWVLVRNKLFSTTHSLPSGVWLTGLFNSFYNRCYSACSFAREVFKTDKIPLVSDFFRLYDRVCGDDKLCGAPEDLAPYFNALTVASFFNSIGMTATTGRKQPVTAPSQDISEVSFLKRTFRFHPDLGKVMGPLDLETLLNSVQWFDSTKDMDEVMYGKLHSFQREMYLHPNGDDFIRGIAKAAKKNNVDFPLLSKEYIKNLYLNEPNVAHKLYYQDNQKYYNF